MSGPIALSSLVRDRLPFAVAYNERKDGARPCLITQKLCSCASQMVLELLPYS